MCCLLHTELFPIVFHCLDTYIRFIYVIMFSNAHFSTNSPQRIPLEQIWNGKSIIINHQRFPWPLLKWDCDMLQFSCDMLNYGIIKIIIGGNVWDVDADEFFPLGGFFKSWISPSVIHAACNRMLFYIKQNPVIFPWFSYILLTSAYN